MKRSMNIITACIISLMLVSCKSTQVVSDQVRGIDFTKYSTYAWAPNTDTSNWVYNNDVVKENIRQEINQALKERGFIIDKANPDFLIRTSLKSEEKEEIRSYYNPHPWYWPPFGSRAQQEIVRYTQNTIVIDMIDQTTKQQVWRGWASRNNSFPYTDMVREVLRKFPVDKSKEKQGPAISSIFN